MKTDLKPSIVRMEPELLQKLVKEVKETVAVNVAGIKTKQSRFGVADLWNIRRKTRTSADWMNR